jgi:hypothetical protein
LRFWGLSAREIKQVSALIKWDEARSRESDSLEIIFVVLRSPVLKASLRPAIALFAANEIKSCLSQGRVSRVNEFMARLHQLSEAAPKRISAAIYWDLKKKLATGESLSILLASPAMTEEGTQAAYEDLRYFLYQLPPQAAKSLAELLSQVKSLKIKELFVEVIAWEICQHDEGLHTLLKELNEWALLELIARLSSGSGNGPIQIVGLLTRHQSPAVRQAAAKAIMDREPSNLSSLAHLILDKDTRVSGLVRPYLEKKKDPSVASILMSFLNEAYSGKEEDPELLLNSYRSFGKCANQTAVPFLAQVLLKKDFKGLFGGGQDNHRLGAAMALLQMKGNQEAEDTLKKASRSAFRNVRQAYRQAVSALGIKAN